MSYSIKYRGADKSLARPGRKQARKHVRDARNFNNIETRAVIKFFFFFQGKAPNEIHAIPTETLTCFLPGRAKDLSALLYLRYIRTWHRSAEHKYQNITFSAQKIYSHSDTRNRKSWFYPQPASNKQKGISKETDLQRDSSTRRYY